MQTFLLRQIITLWAYLASHLRSKTRNALTPYELLIATRKELSGDESLPSKRQYNNYRQKIRSFFKRCV